MNEDSIFLEALQQDSPEARAAYLDQACAGNAELREGVERLLRAHERADDVLPNKAPGLPATTGAVVERPGAQIGPYRLLEQIGEGGFGVVFMAEQHQPVRRRVALKVIKPGMDTRQVIARFEQERQALALMDHPNIAKVIDAGTTASGRPYFVMELIRGVPITQYCDSHLLTPRQRLELFVPVCQAVQHAHQKGIIHRDLKPTNVLVTLHDGQPLVKVIDFGVAKATGQQLTEKTLFTNFAQMVGTPLYMSPEQAELTSQDIDTRSDIYSLGVLLYELLTGTTPFEKQRFQDAAFDEIRRIIREEEPPRPSLRLSSLGDTLPSISALRHMEPGALRKLVRGELDWIVMKCLEKDRNRRYSTANGLIRDLERYLHDEPVEACPPSARYKLMKFARKHRRAFATAAGFLLMLIAAVVVSAVLAVRARIAEADALAQSRKTAQAQARAEAVTDFLIKDILIQAAPEWNEVESKVTVIEVVRKAAKEINSGERFENEPLLEATLQHVIGNTLAKLGLPKEAEAHLRRAVELRRKLLGHDDPDRLDAQEDLAFFLTRNGDLREAEALSRETYQARLRVLGPEDAKTLESLDTWCTGLGGLGQHSQSIPLRQKCFETRRRVQGEAHPQTLQSMNNLGVDFVYSGRPDEAAPILRKCLDLKIEHKESRATTLATRNSLALALLALGEFSHAEDILNEALDISREATGQTNDTLHLQYMLVRVWTGAGKLDRAESLGEDTLAARRELLAPTDSHLGRTLVVVGLALVLKEEYKRADPYLREAVGILREKPNLEDWIGQAQMCRATALIGLGRAAEAEPMLKDAWPKYQKDQRVFSWQKQRTIEAVAAAYDQAGQTAKAAEWRAKLAAKSEPGPE
jgi:non-specific serine/threonine protein kinase/serine/threonine-protein kinase